MTLGHKIICGDAAQELENLQAGSVSLTVTSPPYFKHRDYGPAAQIGQEASLASYLKSMKIVLEQLLRVTAANGSCFIVVGDTYRSGKLLLVPHRLAIIASDIGWSVRNDIILHKLDPAPDSAKNRWRAGHEHILFLAKESSGYVFNDDAIRVPYSPVTLRRWGNGQTYGGEKSAKRLPNNEPRVQHGKSFTLNPNGCIPTDVWSLPNGNTSAEHYAAFSKALVARMIEACSCKGDIVLDPFVGSGTAAVVAKALGRSCIGIELNPKYASMARVALDKQKAGAECLKNGAVASVGAAASLSGAVSKVVANRKRHKRQH
jgi:DNA modification methylase